MLAHPTRQHLPGNGHRSDRRPRRDPCAPAHQHHGAVRDLRERAGSPMRWPLSRRRQKQASLRMLCVAWGLGVAAAAALSVSGCSVNSLGLVGTDAAADVPVDAAPVDTGPEVACVPCDSAATFVTLPGGRFTGTTA